MEVIVVCSPNPVYWKSATLTITQLQDNTGSSSEEEEAEEEDVDVALKKEVAQLQASGTKQERRFQALDSGANNVIFIRTQNLGKRLTEWIVGGLPFRSMAIMLFWPSPRIWQAGSSHPLWSPHHQEEEVPRDPSDATSEKPNHYSQPKCVLIWYKWLNTGSIEGCYNTTGWGTSEQLSFKRVVLKTTHYLTFTDITLLIGQTSKSKQLGKLLALHH